MYRPLQTPVFNGRTTPPTRPLALFAPFGLWKGSVSALTSRVFSNKYKPCACKDKNKKYFLPLKQHILKYTQCTTVTFSIMMTCINFHFFSYWENNSPECQKMEICFENTKMRHWHDKIDLLQLAVWIQFMFTPVTCLWLLWQYWCACKFSL